MNGKPFVWQMIIETIDSLNGPVSIRDIQDFIHKKWGDVKDTTISLHVRKMTINNPSRINWPENQFSRAVDPNYKYDVLFSLGKGLYVKYDINRHGVWEIVKEESGSISVRQKIQDQPILLEKRNTRHLEADQELFTPTPELVKPIVKQFIITKNQNTFNHNQKSMSRKITRPASMVKQGDLILYATSLKVSDLLIPNFYSIERLDPENASEKGYQRLLNKARAKKLSDYIIDGQDSRDAFLPTSLFIATSKDIGFNPSNNTIDIDIDEVGPFNIVDGQHRVEGLKMASEKDPRVLEFEVPVNIAINLSEISQMCHFLIVNTTQKSVEEGVAQRIRARLTKAIGVDDMPYLPKWILNSVQKGEDDKALQFIDFLNSEKDSPWFNRIIMANDENSEGSINQKSFVKAIKKYILVANNPIINTVNEDKQLRIFLNYWKAITNIIGSDDSTVLFKYNGVELFCKFCVPFFREMINKTDFKVPTMQSLLQEVFDNVEGEGVGLGHADFWAKGGKASGLNASPLNKIHSEMLKALYQSSEIQKGGEMEV